ncbi:hypothetical protein DVH24_030356 [Malus domestica]|uniref:EF-hand domain-containing protein n=1 Tax=Malus domestica TaxID=3750 RepID=A0A498K548_MALDO|nr:hypothetical protein DVH24_030356 [Malus domestica]
MLMEIEIEIGEGERETEAERQREKEREEWGSQRHCCRSLIFFDPIFVFFSASHSRNIARPLTHSLTTGHTGAPTLPFSGKTSPQNHYHSLRSAQDTQAKAFHCAVAPATVHRLLLRDSPLPTSREKVAAAAVGKKNRRNGGKWEVFSCSPQHNKCFVCAEETPFNPSLPLRADYDEFIAATMHLNWMDREHLYTTFQHFDKDSSRYAEIMIDMCFFILFYFIFFFYIMLFNSKYITRSRVIIHHDQHLIYNNVAKMHSDYQVYHDGRTKVKKYGMHGEF